MLVVGLCQSHEANRDDACSVVWFARVVELKQERKPVCQAGIRNGCTVADE